MSDGAFIGMMPTVNPFGGPQAPSTAQAMQSDILDYRNQEQNFADQAAQAKAQEADDTLKKFNEHTGRITSKNMGKACAQCQKGYKTMTIDKLQQNAKTSYGTEIEGGFSKILGFSQSRTTKINATEVSGDYYYIDQNQDWIFVHAAKAFKGTSGEAEVKGGPEADVGLFSGKVQAPMSSEIEAPENSGLLRP